MLRVAAVVLVLTSGCASLIGPLVASEDLSPSHGPDEESTKVGCGTVGAIIGAAIDGVVIASDLLISSPDYGLGDVAIIAPFALDVLIGAALQSDCLSDD